MDKNLAIFEEENCTKKSISRRKKVATFGLVGVLVAGVTLASLTQSNSLWLGFSANPKKAPISGGNILVNKERVFADDHIDLIRGGIYDKEITSKDLPMHSGASTRAVNFLSTYEEEASFSATLFPENPLSFSENLVFFAEDIKSRLQDLLDIEDDELQRYLDNFVFGFAANSFTSDNARSVQNNPNILDSILLTTACIVNLSLSEIIKNKDNAKSENFPSGCHSVSNSNFSLADSLKRFNDNNDIMVTYDDVAQPSLTFISIFKYRGNDPLVGDFKANDSSKNVRIPEIPIVFERKGDV